MRRIKIHEIFFLLLLIVPTVVVRGQAAEYNATTNWIYPSAQKFVGLNFINSSKGELINNGTVIYNCNFTNDGTVDFKPNLALTSALTEFSGSALQHISGSGNTRFYNLYFFSKLVADAFSLEQNVTVVHSVDFKNGILKSVQTTPETPMNMLLLENGASAVNASDKAFADGFVQKTGNTAFTFPVGNAGFYRPISIDAPKTETDCFVARYLYVNPDDAGYLRNKKIRAIESISNKEYWVLNQTSGTSTGQLTLTWDATKTSAPLMDDLSLLVVARWDGSQWINEGSVGSAGDANTGSIMANVTGYGIFTLAKLVLNPPVAMNDSATTLEDVAVTGNVLTNDSVFDGRALSVTGFTIAGTKYKADASATIPSVGTITIAAKGDYNFIPATDYYGVVPTINYIIYDGKAKPDTATLALKVQPMPEFIKMAGNPSVNPDGTFNLVYTMIVDNDTPDSIRNMQVEDDLDKVIKDKGCTYTVTGVAATGVLKANGLYNGSSNIKTLAEGLSLAPGQKDSILFEVKVDTQGQDESVSIVNQATLNGTMTFGGISLKSRADNSVSDPTTTSLPLILIKVPDGFSPNGDGINDLLYIKRVNNTKVEIHVYTSQGAPVYSNSDYQNNWDGTGTGFLGKILPDGTYYFTYKLTSTITGEVVEKGVKFITLRQ